MHSIAVILPGDSMSLVAVGAFPSVAVGVCGVVIVFLHPLLGWLIGRFKVLAKLVEGDKILLYHDDELERRHLRRGLLTEDDLMQGVRKSAMTMPEAD